ncbi:MAG: 5-(carboxyamino)imidazole ribonucleotide synthase [Alphaproteobacteria bacterium]|jgi:5-(carboxyamino)imidazole ribonucleotide synthase|nr:5-(carboxyamino)imidazole ribonucleotide synthase [Alphaproteobacteria bacterium]
MSRSAQDKAGPLPPGSVIGILGGGQLGRMTALAAARLGYRTHVFCPEPDSPCAQVTDRRTQSSYEDRAALEHFAAAVDVVTLEFENVPCETVAFLERLVPARPSAAVLAVCQDRLLEKRFVSDAGIRTAAFAEVGGPGDLAAALDAVGRPAVLKARRFGYDGKAQLRLEPDSDPSDAWARIGARPAIVEAFIPFAAELSVIVARSPGGEIRCFPAVENRHANHILAETIAPAALAPALAAEAEAIARTLAEALALEGLLAVELFLTRDDRLLVNELAPRPHNSGHWTIDAAATSQFEQLVRAACGLPLGAPTPLADAVMTNLLGDDINLWRDILEEPGAHLHLYGKNESRPGRKMGHVTRLRPSTRGNPTEFDRITLRKAEDG